MQYNALGPVGYEQTVPHRTTLNVGGVEAKRTADNEGIPLH